MITVIKLDTAGEEKTRYQAEILERLPNGVKLEAYWQRARLDLGYTCFEPGDHFIEYFYTDHWFNIFAISGEHGSRKGWYCNIAAPAFILTDRIEQVDLLLDVWVDPQGHPLILDEDEFEAATTLSAEQRAKARLGLQELLRRIKAHEDPFLFSPHPNWEERMKTK